MILHTHTTRRLVLPCLGRDFLQGRDVVFHSTGSVRRRSRLLVTVFLSHATTTPLALRSLATSYRILYQTHCRTPSRLPFYYEAKVVFIIWLVFHKKAAVTLYQRYIHPTLETYEGLPSPPPTLTPASP